MSDTCCIGCLADPFLLAVVSQRGVVRDEETCPWCGCEGHRAVDLVDLAAMFRKVVAHLYVTHSAIPRWYQVDSMDGGSLGDAMGDSFSERVTDRNGLATEIVNADLDLHGGDTAFCDGDTLWHPREVLREVKYDENHPCTIEEAPFEELVESHYRTLAEALNRYGHSLDPHGRCGPASGPSVVEAVQALRAEFAKHVYSLPAVAVLHRARIEQAERLCDLNDVNPPPARISRSGRVNLAGQRALYAASTRATAIAEVRPALGDRVVVGSLILQRTARVLDLANAPHHELTRFDLLQPDRSARLRETVTGETAVAIEPRSVNESIVVGFAFIVQKATDGDLLIRTGPGVFHTLQRLLVVGDATLSLTPHLSRGRRPTFPSLRNACRHKLLEIRHVSFLRRATAFADPRTNRTQKETRFSGAPPFATPEVRGRSDYARSSPE